MRILSITIIVLYHYQQVFKVRFSGFGFFGGPLSFGYLVELFFMISGYLTVYTDRDTLNGCNLFRTNVQRFTHKLLRYYPMASIACAFTLAVKTIKAEDLTVLWNIKSLAANFGLIFEGWPFFSMVGYNEPTWYLCILTKCFLWYYAMSICFGSGLWQMVKEKARSKSLLTKKGIVCDRLVCYAVFVFAVRVLRINRMIGYTTYRGLYTFFIGVCLCELKKQIPVKKWIPALLVVLSAMIYFMVFRREKDFLFLLFYPAVLLFSEEWDGIKNKSICRITDKLGKITFDVLVWHYPLMALEKAVIRLTGLELNRTYLTMAGFTIITWVVSWLIWFYVELPISQATRKARKT